MERTGTGTAALALLTLANLADLVSIGFVGTPGNPAWFIVPGFVLSVVGLVATVPAWRGRPAAVAVVFTTRAVSTLMALPYYLLGEQPDYVRTGLAVGMLVSLVGLILVVVWWRKAAVPA
ncbi:hypothetical protein [Actinomycetospora termitidis]|uniref:Integral membrane protein n=1 Tax=Actinomycetospora termitidis TaxID=3053470 RepID=A0ABT7M3B0_9PSEU|nr:hypothetical protein [Actinomycetospora sp. Odt1-22]MDL5155134.1 hypothetical protein [Actinomycetospora sp. Odt1-22]